LPRFSIFALFAVEDAGGKHAGQLRIGELARIENMFSC